MGPDGHVADQDVDFPQRLDTFVDSEQLPPALGILLSLAPWRLLPIPDQSRGTRLRLSLEALGPVFIKFGQMLSTRRDLLPDDAVWASFGISRMQMPMVAKSVLLGGNVRVGLEDNLYLERGVFASNGQLVEKAVGIIERLGARVLSPDEARVKLGLPPRS